MADQHPQQSDAILLSIMQSSTDHIFLIDLEGRIQFINRTVSDLSIDKVRGHFVFEFVAAEYHPLMRECFHQVTQTLQAGRFDVDYYNSKEELVQSFESRVSPVIQEGRAVALTISATDITQRKRLNEELREQQERLAHVGRVGTMGEMAAGIAHEVSQPLSAIANFAAACGRLADADEIDRDRLKEWLRYISEETVRVRDIVEGLRSFVKRSDSQWAPHNVHDIVQKSLTFMASELRQRQVRTDVVTNEDIPLVRCDEVQIQQVLINLIKNACEALAESDRRQRCIRITTQDRGDSVEIIVADNGPGFPDATADKLFVCFFSNKKNGMGMGLAISRSIVEAHGGRIWAETPATAGASFHFTLPFAESALDLRKRRA